MAMRGAILGPYVLNPASLEGKIWRSTICTTARKRTEVLSDAEIVYDPICRSHEISDLSSGSG